MFALQIQNLLSFTRPGGGTSPSTLPGHRKLDELFAVLARFEAVGDNTLHDLWLRAEHGPIEAFGDVEEWLEKGEVSSRKEFESWWQEIFPRENKWFRLSAAEHRGTDKIGIIPDNIITRYCESCFPGISTSDFTPPPCEKPAREALLPHVQWLPLPRLCLKPEY